MRDPSSVGLVLLVSAALLLAPVVGTVVVSAAPVQNETYAVAQGTSCTVVEPVVDDSQNAFDFYDYRNPDTVDNGNQNATTYSSYGTREYQETSTSALFFYEGSEGGNLVLVHDELGDEAGGSTLTMEFDGLPADGEWVVEDDKYPGRDDEWEIGETTTTVDWKWGDNRTDGGVYSGVGNMSGTIVVTPGFNEEAAAWGDWGYSGSDQYRLDEWRLLDADGSETTLDRDRRLFIHGGGCEETPPSAALTGPTSAEVEQTITLDASETTDDGAVGGYEWDLDGDGEVEQITTEPTLEHAFSETGEHTVSVTAFDTYGNGDTAQLAVNVTQPASPPTATLDAPDQVTVNETLTLDASGSTDEGTIASYEWDLDGDGEIEQNTSEPTIEHSYGEAGTFEPTVTVVDDDGERDTASAAVEVLAPNQPPNASLDAPAAVDEGQAVTLDASGSTDDRGIEEYRWDANGDGEFEDVTEEPTFEHTYDEPGNYTAEVVVVDTNGETARANASIRVRNVDDPPTAALTAPDDVTVNETVTFDASDSSDDFGIQRYEWDVDGDGAVDRTTTGPTLEHVYNATATGLEVSVTVFDTANQTAADTETLDVLAPNEPPNASLEAPANATEDEPVTFDASGSTDDRGIDRYEWDFDGDGEVDRETEEPVVEHTYADPGTENAEVVVVDTDGATSRANATVQVAAVNDPPSAALDAPAEVARNETVTLDASASSDEEGIRRYAWDFDGDGTVDRNTTGPTVQHAYAELGEFDVTVTVIDTGNQTDTAEATTTVVDPDELLSVALDAPGTATVNESVVLSANVSGGDDDDDDADIERYEWDLDGDGEIDEETEDPTLEHTFQDTGRVTVSVTAVADDDDETASATATVVVGDPAAANAAIAVATDEPTAGEPVSFEADATAATSIVDYSWTFGDGTTGSGASLGHTYDQSGSYEVTLEITTAAGVTTSTTATVTVAQGGNGNTGGGNGNDGDNGNTGGGGNNAGGQQGGGQQGGGQQGGSQDPAPEPSTPEPEPDIGQANVSLASERLLTGESLVVKATVVNEGDATGTKTVEFEVEGQIIEERVLSVAPGERRTVTFRYRFDSPGEKAIEVDHGRTRYVVVEAREPNITVTELTMDEQQVQTGESFSLTATVSNNGTGAGTHTVALELFGDTVASRNVSVPVGESVQVTFNRSVMAPGSYNATVGNESVTVKVVGTETTETTGPTDTQAPGFGVGAVAAALALLAAVLAVRRQ